MAEHVANVRASAAELATSLARHQPGAAGADHRPRFHRDERRGTASVLHAGELFVDGLPVPGVRTSRTRSDGVDAHRRYRPLGDRPREPILYARGAGHAQLGAGSARRVCRAGDRGRRGGPVRASAQSGGLLNGFAIAAIGIPPILATLGTGLIFTGIAVVLSGGAAVLGFPDAISVLGNGTLLGRSGAGASVRRAGGRGRFRPQLDGVWAAHLPAGHEPSCRALRRHRQFPSHAWRVPD